MERIDLMDGVRLTYIHEDRFKTNTLSIQLLTPLKAEHAAENALLVSVLRHASEKYPDMQAVSRALDLLYGTSVSATVRKKGETQCIGFVSSFIDDRMTPDHEKLLEPVAAIMGEMLCAPILRDGAFVPEYVASERENLLDRIRGQINDKRTYASLRLLEEMCADERYGISSLGREEEASIITPRSLYARYREVLSKVRIEIFYCGSADRERVADALQAALRDLPRTAREKEGAAQPHPPREEVRFVTEELDVTQGKLAMGLSSRSPDYPALLLFSTIYGGSATSKLFLNVREKESLCYYASAVLHRQKNLITVSAGIETSDYDKAYDEILAQLHSAQNGEIEQWEEEGARSSMRHNLRAMRESMGQMEDFYLGQATGDTDDTIESLSADLDGVTRERMLDAASQIALDTVYFLKNREEAGKL